jgi:hypothetical protein
MISRPPSYQQCVAIARLARWMRDHHTTPDDEQLRELAGAYASNIIAALIDRRLIYNVNGHWQLTDEGWTFAGELLGDDVRHLGAFQPLRAEG